jgi:hypothetical protein
LEYDILVVSWQKMKMTFVHVPKQKDFLTEVGSVNNIIVPMIVTESYTAVGYVGKHFLFSFFDTTNTYYMIIFCWYVPYSVKYPKWRSSYRILSVDLWLVLI